MSPEELKILFEKEFGTLTPEDESVIESNRKFEEASKIISGTAPPTSS